MQNRNDETIFAALQPDNAAFEDESYRAYRTFDSAAFNFTDYGNVQTHMTVF